MDVRASNSLTVNIDAPAVGTFTWTEKEIRQLLELFNLAIDTPLSVLAVEMMPRYDQYIILGGGCERRRPAPVAGPRPVPDSPHVTARGGAGGLLRELLMALNDPATLADALQQAGFRDVEVRAVPFVYRFPSLADTLRNLKDAQPPLTRLLDQLSDADRAVAWTEIERSLRPFLTKTGSRGQPKLSSPPEWPEEWLATTLMLSAAASRPGSSPSTAG